MDENEDDIINVVSDSDNEVDTVKPNQFNSYFINSGILKSFVSARTDGIRGKRYADYHISDNSSNSEAENGELKSSESELDVDVEGIDDEVVENDLKTGPSLSKRDSLQHSDGVIKNPNNIEFFKTSRKRPMTVETRTTDDVFGIASYLQDVPDAVCHIDGVKELTNSYRKSDILSLSSSDDADDEELKLEDSSIQSDILSVSSNDSDCVQISVSDLNEMSSLNLVDHVNKELFPEVEIIDLTLSDIEKICLLGEIFQIVEDFVVIKCGDSNKILDLDSMVFDRNRKCVGYIFEVLGPVTDPYYSIRFNTNSDIHTLGLSVSQELFYSPNERYSRYVLVEFLKELESRRYRDKSDDEVTSQLGSDCDSDSSESSVSAYQPRKRRLKGYGQNHHNQLTYTRSTHNYTINYKTHYPMNMTFSQNVRPSSQITSNYNSFLDQWTSASSQPSLKNQSQILDSEKIYTTQKKQFTGPPTKSMNSNGCNQNSKPKNDLFRNSVLSSFLDPTDSDSQLAEKSDSDLPSAKKSAPKVSEPTNVPPAEMFAIPKRDLTF